MEKEGAELGGGEEKRPSGIAGGSRDGYLVSRVRTVTENHTFNPKPKDSNKSRKQKQAPVYRSSQASYLIVLQRYILNSARVVVRGLRLQLGDDGWARHAAEATGLMLVGTLIKLPNFRPCSLITTLGYISRKRPCTRVQRLNTTTNLPDLYARPIFPFCFRPSSLGSFTVAPWQTTNLVAV